LYSVAGRASISATVGLGRLGRDRTSSPIEPESNAPGGMVRLELIGPQNR
jgi:hypothetical protein